MGQKRLRIFQNFITYFLDIKYGWNEELTKTDSSIQYKFKDIYVLKCFFNATAELFFWNPISNISVMTNHFPDKAKFWLDHCDAITFLPMPCFPHASVTRCALIGWLSFLNFICWWDFTKTMASLQWLRSFKK